MSYLLFKVVKKVFVTDCHAFFLAVTCSACRSFARVMVSPESSPQLSILRLEVAGEDLSYLTCPECGAMLVVGRRLPRIPEEEAGRLWSYEVIFGERNEYE